MSFTGSSYPHEMHAQYNSTFPQLEGLGSAPGLSDQVRRLLLKKRVHVNPTADMHTVLCLRPVLLLTCCLRLGVEPLLEACLHMSNSTNEHTHLVCCHAGLQ